MVIMVKLGENQKKNEKKYFLTLSENGLGGTSLDTGDIPILGSDPVDSTDDLVPSLLPDELSSELLDEMQSIINSKSDNGMTWL